MNERRKQSAPRISLATILQGTLICVISFGLFVLSGGNLAAAMVPVLAIGAVVALFALPLRHTYLVFASMLMLVSNFQLGPMEGRWNGPLTIIGDFLRRQLADLSGIGALKFSVAELGLCVFALIVVIRTILHNNIDNHLTHPASRHLKSATIITFLALLVWAAIGFLRGANPTHIVYQARTLFGFQLCLIISMRAFKDEKTFRLLGRVFVGICMLRILEAAYFYYAIAGPRGYRSEMMYITTHTDSFLFVGALSLLILEVLEKPGFKAKRNLVFFGAIIMWAVVVNDRRVAFMSLAFCVFLSYFFLSPRIKRTIKRTLIRLSPILLLYVAIGLNSKSPIFKPVQTFVSVNDSTDGSNLSRKVENFNLAYTLKRTPVMGTGFGAPYQETIPAVRLGDTFGDAMMYMAHNHLLWLAFLLGAVGFYLFLLPLMVGCYLAFRTHKYAQNANQRIALLWAICSVIVYLVQSYADMGSTLLKGHLLVSIGFAAVANLSTKLYKGRD